MAYESEADAVQEQDAVIEPAPAEAPSQAQPMASGVLISAVVHGVVLFVFSLVVLVAQTLEEEAPAVKITQIDVPQPKPEQPKLPRDVENVAVPIDVDQLAESDRPSPISQIEVPIDDADSVQREEDQISEIPRGRDEAVADSEIGGQGAFMAIGAGGGSSGMFGSRQGSGKKRALGRFGGSKASENSVEMALQWFKKHQEPTGKWDPSSYQNNCADNPKCEPVEKAWVAGERADIAMTGLVVLCYLGAGYDQRMPSRFRGTVRAAIDVLLKEQTADGRWPGESSPGNYTLGICTMALSEAYAMSQDPRLREPAQKAVDAILACQIKDDKSGYGYGWGYSAPSGPAISTPSTRCDASITPWMILAMKSARAAGLNIGDVMDGAARWLEIAWKSSNDNWQKMNDPYRDEAELYYDFDIVTQKKWYGNGTAPITEGGSDIGRLSSAGALCAIFIGKKSGDIVLESLVNFGINRQLPTAYPPNLYYMYYNTLTMFMVGGERWQKWNGKVRDLLVAAQRVGNGCFDGSWDYQGSTYFGHYIGRIASTALCCLSLEVYYRYLPVALRDHK
jgi:hypothetical protein